jgi:hypothetical protein
MVGFKEVTGRWLTLKNSKSVFINLIDIKPQNIESAGGGNVEVFEKRGDMDDV